MTVTVDQYAYPASSTSLDMRLPNWAVAGGRDEGRKRLADPATREKIVEEMKQNLKEKGFADYSFAYVASYGPNLSSTAKTLPRSRKSFAIQRRSPIRSTRSWRCTSKAGPEWSIGR